jgi:tRNA (guanine37-N1)-methyltransferase
VVLEMSSRFTVVTIFPEVFSSLLATSLLGRAVESGLVAIDFIDPRDFTSDPHRRLDDTPYGGGSGMVMEVEPVVAALESIPPSPGTGGSAPAAPLRVLLCPQGEPLRQRHLERLAKASHVVLVCGRYEGVDERIRDFVDLELSLGDFVLAGGEVAAMAVLDGTARLVPGVIGNADSLEDESHVAGLLEYPQYTRPRSYRGREVPEILLSGDHERIRTWRARQRLLRTRTRRPDLWARFQPTSAELALLGDEDPIAALARRTYVALLHHPVHDREGKVVATAVTNLDLHDIARSARSYGLAGYFVVTPLTSQRELASRIAEHWRTGHGARHNHRRREALALLEVAPDLDEVLRRIVLREGREPVKVATSAIARPGQISRAELLERLPEGAPLLVFFGTGWGLTDDALARADLALAPVRGRDEYNHLSVRSAAAIVLDRLFGLRE